MWNAGAIAEANAEVIEPTLFPGNIAIASAGDGIAVANGMSEEKDSARSGIR